MIAVQSEKDYPMPVTVHLEALRAALVRSASAILVGVAVAYYFSDSLVLFLEQPLLKVLPADARHLYFTGVADKFMVYFQVSSLAGFVCGLPYLLYEVWKFVSPALSAKERQTVVPILFTSFFVFIAGVCFSYVVVMPSAFGSLIGFGSGSDKAIITLGQYFSFSLKLLVGIGAIFELPVIMLLLARFGLLTAPVLMRHRRLGIVVSAIVGAMISPSSDIASILAVMISVYLLYEVGIIAVRCCGTKSEKVRPSDFPES